MTARGRIVAAAALVVGLLTLLSLTGPQPDLTVSGTVRRFGGVCLELERWGLTGWRLVGQSHTVSDIQNGVWHPRAESPPCAQVQHREYLIRPPFDAPNGVYRLCGLDDERPCVEFRRVPFQGTPEGSS